MSLGNSPKFKVDNLHYRTAFVKKNCFSVSIVIIRYQIKKCDYVDFCYKDDVLFVLTKKFDLLIDIQNNNKKDNH
jgi:hypothetical protein